MGTLSPIHWILVAIVVLLVFGPKTLSKVGRSVGQGMRSVNKVKQGFVGDPVRALTAPLPPEKKKTASTPPKVAGAEPPASEPPPEPIASGETPAEGPQKG
jgi:sec-independent protein translocase protein TatA